MPSEPKVEGKTFYLVTGTSVTNHVYSHIRQHAIKEQWNITLQDLSRELSILSIQGPLSRNVLQKITDDDLSNISFPYMTNKIITVAGYTVRALRVSFIGELGEFYYYIKNN